MARLVKYFSLLSAVVLAQSSFSPARPPAIPLAVRSPYLSTWQAAGSDGGNGGYLAGQWPTFWDSQNGPIIIGWTGFIRVDNTTYTWMGDPDPLPTLVNQTAFSYTSTRSIFTMDVAGLVTMNITFLSPVSPKDKVRQSFPVSYMTVDVQSADGNKHDVAIYTDISAEWTSGDRSQVAEWSYGVDKSSDSTSRKRSAEPAAQWQHHEPWEGEGPKAGWPRTHSGPQFEGNPNTLWTDSWSAATAPSSWSSTCSVTYVTTTLGAVSEPAATSVSTPSSAASSIAGSAAVSAIGFSSTANSLAVSSSLVISSAAISPVALSATESSPTNASSSSTSFTSRPSTSSPSTSSLSTNSSLTSAPLTSTSLTNNASSSATALVSAIRTSANTTSAFSPTTTSNATTTSLATGTSTVAADGVAYHKVWRQIQQEFTEDVEQAAWGHWFYATDNVDGLSHQSGRDIDVRGQFIDNGVLNNTEDTNYRAINDDWPVFGFAVNLGSVGSDAVSSVFTINLAQELAIQFRGYGAVEQLPSLWTSYFDNGLSAVSFFYNDYDSVAQHATNLDNQVASDSTSAGGSDYLTLTALAVRQAFGALTLVGNTSTQYIFLKEISSDGDIQTVDVIFPFFPILVYMNPSWLKMLLTPLFINQEAGDFTQGNYSEHDLGIYPNATQPGTEMQPVEECGNMLIMTLAYTQHTGDTDYLNDNYALLDQWTQYLIDDSLIPGNQISTDDFAGALANQTNLALKGIIGINAMAVIANMTGHASEGANYTAISQSYISQWQGFGLAHDASPPHSTLAYGMNDTHGLLYNLYADALLQTQLVPKSVYQMQSNFYPYVDNTYGVPLDTRHEYTKNDWEMFCAAIAESNTTSMFIGNVAKWIGETTTDGPVTDLYGTQTGDYPANIQFMARPVVGGWFALLALNQTGIPAGNPS